MLYYEGSGMALTLLLFNHKKQNFIWAKTWIFWTILCAALPLCIYTLCRYIYTLDCRYIYTLEPWLTLNGERRLERQDTYLDNGTAEGNLVYCCILYSYSECRLSSVRWYYCWYPPLWNYTAMAEWPRPISIDYQSHTVHSREREARRGLRSAWELCYKYVDGG